MLYVLQRQWRPQYFLFLCYLAALITLGVSANQQVGKIDCSTEMKQNLQRTSQVRLLVDFTLRQDFLLSFLLSYGVRQTYDAWLRYRKYDRAKIRNWRSDCCASIQLSLVLDIFCFGMAKKTSILNRPTSDPSWSTKKLSHCLTPFRWSCKRMQNTSLSDVVVEWNDAISCIRQLL